MQQLVLVFGIGDKYHYTYNTVVALLMEIKAHLVHSLNVKKVFIYFVCGKWPCAPENSSHLTIDIL